MQQSEGLSEAQHLVHRLVQVLGRDTAEKTLDVMLSKFSNVELAALAAYWPFWARPKQLPPTGTWRSWGFLAGRGFGKTLAMSKYVNEQVQLGNAMLVGLCAQDEASCVSIQVLGPSGLIATAPPWFRPHWEAFRMNLVWPNGARAYVRTPEVPGKIRGLEYHLSWCTELQSWPQATMSEAHDNVLLSTRLGYARTLWDATPKKRHPLLKERLAMSASEPERHIVVRGTTYENTTNLGDGYVEDLERKLGGTSRGREELLGEMLDDDDDALVHQEWIEKARRPRPERFRLKVLGIDPAITKRKGSDNTGLVLVGRGVDDQGYVLGDRTGKYAPGQWTAIVVDWYVKEEIDLIVVETNKGGDLVVQALRAEAQTKGMQVVVIGKDERVPERRRGIIFVREFYSRGSKEDRANPVAVAYEKGRMSHVIGVNLETLEETLTGWVPNPNADSPDDLDALAIAANEALGLTSDAPDPKLSMVGVPEMAKRLRDGGMRADAILGLLRSHSGRGI